ncbi:MAG: SRPBCC family protein, partial [Pseudomonadota bacterium]
RDPIAKNRGDFGMAPMMRLVLGLGVLVLILSAVALGLPAHVTATRSVVINAPEYVIFPYVNDLRRTQEWAPWADKDPNVKITYSGPPEGVGAKAEWTSDVASVGNGSIQIVESDPSSTVRLNSSIKGLDGTSDFDLSPAGAGSKVSWSFGFATGSSPLKRWKGLILDSYIGEVYEDGLEKLKNVIEASRAQAIPAAPAPVIPAAPADAETTPEAPAAGGETVVPETPPATQP